MCTEPPPPCPGTEEAMLKATTCAVDMATEGIDMATLAVEEAKAATTATEGAEAVTVAAADGRNQDHQTSLPH